MGFIEESVNKIYYVFLKIYLDLLISEKKQNKNVHLRNGVESRKSGPLISGYFSAFSRHCVLT